MYIPSSKTVSINFQSSRSRSDDSITGEKKPEPLQNSNLEKRQSDIDSIDHIKISSDVRKNSKDTPVYDQLLSHAYRELSKQFALSPELEAKMSEVKGYNDGQPITAEKASSNILGFIERRILLDIDGGASQEQLASRLEAGREGFEKGFAQAQEQLEALSLLSPAISADIGDTYDLVLSGINKLREKYLAFL